MAMRIDSKLPKGDIKSFRHIFNYVKPHRKKLIGVLLALIFSSGAVLSIGAGIKYLVDKGFATGNPDMLNQALFLLFVIIIILAVSTYARFYLVTEIGEKVVADIRKDIFKNLLHLSPAFFESTKVSNVMSRLTTDTTVLQLVIGGSMSVAARNILMFIGGIAMILHTSPKLAGYIAIMIPLIVLPIIFLGGKVRNLSRISQNKVAELAANIEEALHGIKIVQSYNRQDIEYRTFTVRVMDALSAAMSRVKLRAALTAIVIILAFGSIGVIIWVGGHDVLAGRLSAGELSSFIFYALVVAGSFGAISEVIGDIQRAAGSTEGLIEFLNAKSDVTEPELPVVMGDNVKADIIFDKVTFNYPTRPETAAIKDLSFAVKEGETVALVGPSGAGKSTIIQLLLRFYDPVQGVIKINGIDIKKVGLKALRGLFAYVPQEPMIFSTSVKENIRFGRAEATDGEIESAAKAASAYDFINKLPQGFDTYLGERGVRLSGGERQRVAIARAVLKSPKILLLDEATSSLDAENEKLVQKALDNLMKGRTTIVIAHRLATIQKADRIIVINEGKIESIGSHAELIRADNTYKRLAELQFLS